jgi:hypothetical protein
MKIRPVGAEFFSMQTEERTDITEVAVALRNFANAPKNDKGIGDIFGACF